MEKEFEKFLESILREINEYINNYFMDTNNINYSLNNLLNLTKYLQNQNIEIEMIDIENLFRNDKLSDSLKNVINHINNDMLRKLNNSYLTTLIITYCKINNIHNNYVQILIDATINPYDNGAQYELIKKVKNGDKRAKESLILANEGLIRSFVAKNVYKIKNSCLDGDDLLQVARMAIIEAAENFDFSRGAKFSTYASWVLMKNINKEIYNYSRVVRLPINVYRLVNEYKYVESLYMTKYGYMPSEDELAQKMKLPIAKIRELEILKKRVMSLDKEVQNNYDTDEDCNISYFIADESQNFEENSIYNIYLDEVKAKLESSSKITARDKMIIKLRYGLDDHIVRTYDYIANIFKLKKERIRQIINSNLEKIGYDNHLNPIPIKQAPVRKKRIY